MGEKRGAYRVLVENPQEKRHLEGLVGKDYIKIYLQVVGWGRGLD
jgi:hypothetical protein